MNNKRNVSLLILSSIFLIIALVPSLGLAYIPEPIPPPPPPPPPSPVTKTVNDYYTSAGTEVEGGLSSFQTMNDGDIIIWTDTSLEGITLLYYNFEFTVYFNYPSGAYKDVDLIVRYKLSSIAVLNFVVRYTDKDSHWESLPDTNGNYVEVTIPLTSYGHVKRMEAACSPMRPWYLGPPPQPWAWIDYMAIKYTP